MPTSDQDLADDIAMLGELARMGMAIAAAIQAKALEAEDPREFSVPYERVARSVHRTVLLRKALRKELGQPAEPAAVTERKAVLRRAVKRVGQREGWMSERIDRLTAERLDSDFLGDILARPISEMVGHIVKDAGMKGDWAVIAKEAWAIEEIESGRPGWPLAGFAQPPDPPVEALPLDGEGLGWGGGMPPPKEPLRAV